jgi:hypothetical protein
VPDTNIPMKTGIMVFIAIYLVLATVLSGSLVYSLWSAPIKVSPPESAKTPADMCKKDLKGLARLIPNALAVGSAGDVQVLGCGFTKDTAVRFNGTKHSIVYIDPTQIRLPLTSTEIAAAGLYVVTLAEKDGDIPPLGTGEILVDTPLAQWGWLGGSGGISQESLFLLLVAFMGAFGSSVYALKSLADYLGDGKLYEEWGTYFLIQPFEGAGIAVLMYLVVRGGFTGASGGDVKSVNQFGICAIAGLAGAFSDTAFMKLREVFQTLFKPQDSRGGKVDQLSIDTATLPDGTHGQPYGPVTLVAKNGTGALHWSVTPDLPQPMALNAVTGIISGTPAAASLATSYTFKVTDSSTPPACAVKVLKLTIN